MRQIFTCFFLLLSAIFLRAQNKEKALPDFAGIHDDIVLSDSINSWYTTEIAYRPKDSVRAQNLLLQVQLQAAKSSNTSFKILSKYFEGSYMAVYQNREQEGLVLMNEAILEAEKAHSKYLRAGLLHDIAMYYFSHNKQAKSLELQLQAFDIYNKLGFEKTKDISLILFDLAFLYYHLGSYNTSLDFLLPSVPFLSRNKRLSVYIKLQTLNTIGLAYRGLQKDDSAIYYFKMTLDTARFYHDTAWIGISSGNIGALKIKHAQFLEAEPYINTYYNCAISQQHRLDGINIAEALIHKAAIAQAKNQLQPTLKYLDEALVYVYKEMYTTQGNLKIRKRMYDLLATTYIRLNQNEKALLAIKKSRAVEDTLISEYNTALYNKVQIQLEAEKNIANIRQLETETKLAIQRRNFSLIGLLLIGLVLFLFYNRQRLKHVNDKELHLSRAKLLESEKLHAEQQLSGYMENLHEKNRIIEEFELEVKRLNQMPNGGDKLHTIETIEKLQKSTIITEDEWIQFKDLFDKVHKGFFTRLKEQYPDLTQAEMRLFALTKLNLSTKEMAGILGISPESIRKARYRFMKKVNSPGESDFSEIVMSI